LAVHHKAHDLDRYAHLLAEAQAIKGVSLGRDAWRRLRRNRAAMLSLGILVLLSLLAVLTPLLPLQAPRKVDTDRSFGPPVVWPLMIETLELNETASSSSSESSLHTDRLEAGFGELNFFNRWLLALRVELFGRWSINSLCGTDELGRDLLSRLFWGARVSLMVALVATLVSLVIGVSYGATSGYLGGWIDNLMMRAVDVLYTVPFIFIVIYLITILSEPSIRQWLESYGFSRIAIFFLLVGAIYWLTMARVVRGQVISLKQEQFVEAARTIGASQARIIFLHLVPNLLSVIIVYLTLTIPQVMLFEAFLSYLGLGVEAPDVSWGVLANEGTRVITPIKIYWWLVLFPGAALAVTLFSLNFLGDGLRDALDPRMKNRT
jgi:oligopeptide transport system permease protein